MANMSENIVETNRIEWLLPHSTQPRPILVSPNHSSGSVPFLQSWICDHAAPQAATMEGQIILCGGFCAARKAGAEFVDESGQRENW